MNQQLEERSESLWQLAAPPLIWAAHLLLSYCTAAIFCEKYALRDDSLGLVRVAIAGYTLLALVAIGYAGARAYRRHRYGDSTTPHDFDTPEDRHRFLGFATFLLAGLSAVAVVFQALPAAFIGSCR
jgi:hypothetical protein